MCRRGRQVEEADLGVLRERFVHRITRVSKNW
jgi:hypothetical protein